MIPFDVHVGPIHPPLVRLYAPHRITNALCSFVVDASKSRPREPLFWSGGRRLQADEDGGEDSGGAASSNETASEGPGGGAAGSNETEPVQQNQQEVFQATKRASQLHYQWECRQLGGGIDDSPSLEVESAIGILQQLCGRNSSRIEIGAGVLPEGLYAFRVRVTDLALPDFTAEHTVTVEVTGLSFPPFQVESPKPNLGATDHAHASFTQMGFGNSCPNPTYDTKYVLGTGMRRARVLLLRKIEGAPDSSLHAIAEVSARASSRAMFGQGSVNVIECSAPKDLLQDGFIYKFRLYTTLDQGDALSTYISMVLQQYADAIADPNSPTRTVGQVSLPGDIWTVDTEPFALTSPASAGTFTVSPVARGIAVQDMFGFDMLWATSNAPLTYSYYYAKVPEDYRSLFEAAIEDPGKPADKKALQTLWLLVKDKMLVLSPASSASLFETPLASGMYIISGGVKDSNGAESFMAAAVEAVSPFRERPTTAPEEIEQLSTYVTSAAKTMRSIRTMNQASSAAYLIGEIVRDFPDLNRFDFRTMLEWDVLSEAPTPTSTQATYGKPILSKEKRQEVIDLLVQTMYTLKDVINQLSPEAFRMWPGMRRLGEHQETGARRLDDHQEIRYQEAPVESLAKTLQLLGLAVRPVLASQLFVQLADLVIQLMHQMQKVHADLSEYLDAAKNLLETEAILLSGMAPAQVPRQGKVVVDITQHVHTVLSNMVFDGVSMIGDALTAHQPKGNVIQLGAKAEGLDRKGGDLMLSTVVYDIETFANVGVELRPNFQQITRWPYPHIQMKPLGSPGFMAKNWAKPESYTAEDDNDDDNDQSGDALLDGTSAKSPYTSEGCYAEGEEVLQRISLVTISWPQNPFMYSTGSLVNVDNNVTLFYTVQMRSCGQQVIANNLASDAVSMTFRLSPDTVRDRRWGYHDAVPYRIVWWEDKAAEAALQETKDATGLDIPETRIRRWTSQDCRTAWQKTQESIVSARCSHLLFSEPGSSFAVELAPRPAYIVNPEAAPNNHIHNVMSYMMLILIFVGWRCYVFAQRIENYFSPHDHTLQTILFVKAEYDRLIKAKRGIFPSVDGETQRKIMKMLCCCCPCLVKKDDRADTCLFLLNKSMRKAWIVKVKTWMRYQKERFLVAWMTLKNEELFYSLEVQELACMRSGTRNALYERFFDETDGEDRADHNDATSVPYALAPPSVSQKAEMQAIEFQPQLENMDEDSDYSQEGLAALQDDRPGELPSMDQPPMIEDSPGQEQDTLALEDVSPEDQLISNQIHADSLPLGWEERVTSDGQLFYTNPQSGESRWEKPNLPPGWEVRVSNKHSRPFYYHTETKQAEWSLDRVEAVCKAWELNPPEKPPAVSLAAAAAAASASRPSQSSLSPEPAQDPVIMEVPQPDTIQTDASQPAVVAETLPADHQMPSGPPAVLQPESQHQTAVPLCLPRPPLESVDCEEPLRPPAEAWPASYHQTEVPDDNDRSGSFGAGQLALSGGQGGGLLALRKEEAGNDSDELPRGWERCYNDMLQAIYYVNTRSQESQWEFPRLPPHWEERVSKEGKVYYVNNLDFRSQWEWPSEALDFARSEDTRNNLPGMLANPGPMPKDMMQLVIPKPEDGIQDLDIKEDMSETDEVDQVDASMLLALQPAAPSPRSDLDADIAAVMRLSISSGAKPPPKWGVDHADQLWIDKHRDQLKNKAAQERRFKCASQHQGIREFVRPYEMEDQDENWEKQLRVVSEKKGNLKKQSMELGHKAQLDKADLREVFPIIQLLEWTKWPSKEIFLRCFIRAHPFLSIFMNEARPTKTHRSLMFLLHQSTMVFVIALVLLQFKLEGWCNVGWCNEKEQVDAARRGFFTLWKEVGEIPWEDEKIYVAAVVAEFTGQILKSCTRKVFYNYKLQVHQSLTEGDVRKVQMAYWHSLAETGGTVCTAWSVFCCIATFVLCCLYPQPRPARVLQSVLMGFGFSLIAWPALRGAGSTLVLHISRKNGKMDGILSLFPGIWEFSTVGVLTPEFLAWRAHRIVQEEQVLRRIHREPPVVGAPLKELSTEAGKLTKSTLSSKGAGDGELIHSSFKTFAKRGSRKLADADGPLPIANQ
eukprot:gnl/MRDRNA2_/MRDRNA2_29512_c0_seq1.p1 gnl/MRDRNA2_/MRDRNA2_29512_c0~~gnl/MRDRNA2_/MRDRNA2_29512_c0_seq1.p1  ORF type:complete len:2188 (+),score=385.03 gnl/MRDRNA2_/MRDRNA2_29512_c0_seq1:314-6565(+)